MDIKVDKLISGSNGTLACISDETILAVGKRYFELASTCDECHVNTYGSAKPDSTRQLDNPTYFPVPITDELLKEIKEKDRKVAGNVVEAAYIIKEYCSQRLCPGCPFNYQTTSSDFVCKCCLRNDDEASITPDKWELPPKEE